MPRLTKKFSEIENSIKRQEALKLLRAEYKPVDTFYEVNAYARAVTEKYNPEVSSFSDLPLCTQMEKLPPSTVKPMLQGTQLALKTQVEMNGKNSMVRNIAEI